ncbi:hypothetical protein IQ268_28065 [Oculatella sp. LEGE 06141]|nr:hypothetical protein [Oculatella sp. LEGE 06141]MBE9182408.1 hypothetical protein [Oculatella sp. LEGE 06141]
MSYPSLVLEGLLGLLALSCVLYLFTPSQSLRGLPEGITLEDLEEIR